jgi:mannosyltransferase
MNLAAERPAPLTLALFAAAACLALWLPTLALLPIWHDEVITMRAIDQPFIDMVGNRLKNVHAPTYFALLQGWRALVGDSVFLLRLPSALGAAFGVACMTLVAYRLGGSRAGGWRAALVLGPLLACFPIMLAEAQDLRPYGLLYGFLGLFACSTAALLDHPRLARVAWPRGKAHAQRRLRLAWYGAGVGAIGMVTTLPLGGLAVLAGDVAVLWAARRAAGKRLLRPWFRLRLLTLLLLGPLLFGLTVNMVHRAAQFWVAEFSGAALVDVLRVAGGARVFWGDPDDYLGLGGEAVLFSGLGLCMVLGLCLARRRASLGLVVSLAVLPPLLLTAISLDTSVLLGRYFAIATPPLVLLAALGLSGLWRRSLPVAAALGFAVLALLFLQSLDTMHRSSKPRIDVATARLRESGIERLGVSVRSEHLAQSVMYQLRDEPRGVRLPPWLVIPAAKHGLVVWIFTTRRSDPLWKWLAPRSGLASCMPVLPGLEILALAERPESLTSSCPEVP